MTLKGLTYYLQTLTFLLTINNTLMNFACLYDYHNTVRGLGSPAQLTQIN